MEDTSIIINLGGLAKPATVFIEKISDAVGGIFKPTQTRRVAKAEADAAMIEAKSQIKITDIHRRAVTRWIDEEARKQANIENITQKALLGISEDAHPENMEDDWITNFFDKCRLISDEDMQKLWGKVLSGEANSPGRFSKKTISLLSEIDKNDAVLFVHLCGFAWNIADIMPLIYETNDIVYASRGINFSQLSHLDDIGLISYQSLGNYGLENIPKNLIVHYYGTPITLTFKEPENNTLNSGSVKLTKAGRQLARISDSSPVEGFMEYVIDRWVKREGLAISSPLKTQH